MRSLINLAHATRKAVGQTSQLYHTARASSKFCLPMIKGVRGYSDVAEMIARFRAAAQASGQRFPDWNVVYQQGPLEVMPWYFPGLDHDLKSALAEMKLSEGTFVDIGTGPGTQAKQLATMGFEVTGSDIAESVVTIVQEQISTVNFVVDDILATKLTPNTFNYAFDRGCFHCLPPEHRGTYIQNIQSVLKPGGILFLKTFGVDPATEGFGPYQFTAEQLEELFQSTFEILGSKESYFDGAIEIKPKAVFMILKKKE